MARHAAQPRRVAIVHDPGHGMPAPHPRGRDTRPQTRRRPEHRLPQLQGTQHFTLGKDIERLAGGAPYDLPEQDGVQVTVGHSGAGRDLGAGGVDEAEGRRAVRGVAIEREGGPQPRRMRQEVPHGDAVPPRAAELADVGRHRRVEANLAAVHQHHQRRRRGQHRERQDADQRRSHVHRGQREQRHPDDRDTRSRSEGSADALDRGARRQGDLTSLVWHFRTAAPRARRVSAGDRRKRSGDRRSRSAAAARSSA